MEYLESNYKKEKREIRQDQTLAILALLILSFMLLF